ncbi:MAG: electron transfer flavoprotein subunit alpha/FixB family protein, partial [Proteobacteria bacterium]|nr:electron transfer flavoprotein subunit alpha/FixB family protein [Pseudomonadota bacterium]
MSKVLVIAEIQNGKLKRSTLELLTVSKKAGKLTSLLSLGSQAAQVATEAAQYGAEEVLCLKDSQFDKYNPELFSAAVADVISKGSFRTVLGSASSMGKDLFPRLAAKIGAGLISDCTELKFEGDQVTVKKPLYSGKALSTMTFETGVVQMVLMRANQLPVEAHSGAGKLVDVTAPAVSLKTTIQDVVKGATEKLDLTEANVIVSGGRGLKDGGNFKMLNDLADVLGATVGASRAVVDAGWVPHEMQVGQTGKTVAPSLYIAVGISGAIQHLAGMSGSKVIVAINNDPNAPIFQKATYGIVGDAFEIVP